MNSFVKHFWKNLATFLDQLFYLSLSPEKMIHQIIITNTFTATVKDQVSNQWYVALTLIAKLHGFIILVWTYLESLERIDNGSALIAENKYSANIYIL